MDMVKEELAEMEQGGSLETPGEQGGEEVTRMTPEDMPACTEGHTIGPEVLMC